MAKLRQVKTRRGKRGSLGSQGNSGRQGQTVGLATRIAQNAEGAVKGAQTVAQNATRVRQRTAQRVLLPTPLPTALTTPVTTPAKAPATTPPSMPAPTLSMVLPTPPHRSGIWNLGHKGSTKATVACRRATTPKAVRRVRSALVTVMAVTVVRVQNVVIALSAQSAVNAANARIARRKTISSRWKVLQPIPRPSMQHPIPWTGHLAQATFRSVRQRRRWLQMLRTRPPPRLLQCFQLRMQRPVRTTRLHTWR